MFSWNKTKKLRGVDGGFLCQVRERSISVSLGKDNIKAEFAVLDRCSHEVLFGLDFLRDGGTYIGCASGQLLIDSTVMSILLECPADQYCYFCTTEDFFLPASSTAFVPVEVSLVPVDHTTYFVLLEHFSYALETKTSSAPCGFIFVTDVHAFLWTTN